ncbi:MAG: hypothetical protein ABL926_04320 [Novosphingobium sp.]|uniref:hypothetical protein n=1 Tax=Novosphingobium sp. TaxID=1874826 RepID=UPI0032B74017
MTAVRIYLILAWTALIAFTAFVIGRDGLGLLPEFFGAIRAGHWPGQFNADFLSMLALSGLWTGWRNGWSAPGWVLAVAAFLLGGAFLMAYLLVLLHREKGDMRRVLLGIHADGPAPARRWSD